MIGRLQAIYCLQSDKVKPFLFCQAHSRECMIQNLFPS